MNKINIVIIDRSKFFRQQLKNILTKTSYINVIATTDCIHTGINTLLTKSPDVILLDTGIPHQEEESSLELLLKTKSVPIIMIADGSIDQTTKTVQAITNGAVDFVNVKDKKNKANIVERENELIKKITFASKNENIKFIKKENPTSFVVKKQKNRRNLSSLSNSIVVIGTSTGGPRALQEILQNIPKAFPAPILIVQHMPKGFTKSLAKRLNDVGNIRVKEAKHGDIIEKGTAYLAPGDYHMRIKKQRNTLQIDIKQDEARLDYRPSINLLFKSAAQIKDIHKIAVVLTGMGKDGAEGVQAIKSAEREAVVLVESKETAVIHGMPSAVIQTNEVTEVLRLEDMADAIIDYVMNRRK